MFRLLKINNHRALVLGPIWDRTIYVGYHHIDHNIFTYSINVYREEDGVSYCSWSLQFQNQLQARPEVLARIATTPAKTLTLPLQLEEAEDEITDPAIMITPIKAKVEEVKPANITVVKGSDYVNPKTSRPFREGEWVRIVDMRGDYRATFWRQLKHDDVRGWFMTDFEQTGNKFYLEYDRHNDTWYLSDDLKYAQSIPKSITSKSDTTKPKTSTAMVVRGSDKKNKTTIVEKDEPMIEEVYTYDTPISPSLSPGSSFASFAETASELLPAELRPVKDKTPETPKIGNISEYFKGNINLSSAMEEFNEHGSVAIRHPNTLPGVVRQVFGVGWSPREGARVVIPGKTGGYWNMVICHDDDGWYVETEDDGKVNVFFDEGRGIWVVDKVF